MSTNTLTIEILGKPVAQKRPRFARRGSFVTTYSNQETEAGRWVAALQYEIQKSRHIYPIPCKLPVTLDIVFIFPVLSSFTKTMLRRIEKGEILEHVSKPDTDNCIKFAKDCMSGIVYHDDNQVWDVHARKYYGLQPKTIMTVKWKTWELK